LEDTVDQRMLLWNGPEGGREPNDS